MTVLMAGSAAAALLCGHAAQAQTTAPNAATVELETIEVQGARPAGTAYEQATGPVPGFTATQSTAGTKTGTPIVDTPASISVVGQPQIQATGARSIPEALRFTPGVRADTFGFDPRVDWFLIRGFDAHDVGYYLDGLQLPSYAFAGFQVDPWTLERLDILRGPASALYGGTGPSGIVDAISKRPTLVPYHRVEVGVDNYGNAYGAFDLSGPVSAGSPWSYRIAALGRGGGTQVDHDDFNRGVVAPSLSYRPDGATTLTFLGQYQRDYAQAGAFLPYVGSVRPAPYGRIPTSLFNGDTSESIFTREQAFLGYEFEHTLDNGLIVRQNLRYAYDFNNNTTPYGEGYVNNDPATAQIARYNFLARDKGRILTLDNQVQGNIDTFGLQQTLLGGIDYRHFIVNDNEGQGDAAPLNILDPRYGLVTQPPNTRYALATYTQDELGFYGQDQIRYGRLNVVASVREDLVATSSNDHLIPSDSAENAPNRTTGRIAAIYDAGFDLHPYAGYATSFNPIIGVNTFSRQLYLPESGEQEEVGVKYGTVGGPILATLALFNLTRDNVLTQDPDNLQNQIQVGQERSRGIELGLNATLHEGLNFVGAFTAYSIQDTKDTTATLVGKVPAAVPEMLSSVFLDYTIPDGAWRGLGFTAGERYVGASYANQLNTLRVPDYWLTDAGLHFARDGYRIAVTAQNLLDRTFVGSCAADSACFYGDRRRVTASLSYTW